MSGLADTGAEFNLRNLEYHQSVAKRHPTLLLNFAHPKYLEDVDPFNINGVEGGE